MYLNKEERAGIADYIQYLEYKHENALEKFKTCWLYKLEIQRSIFNKANIRAKQKNKR